MRNSRLATYSSEQGPRLTRREMCVCVLARPDRVAAFTSRRESPQQLQAAVPTSPPVPVSPAAMLSLHRDPVLGLRALGDLSLLLQLPATHHPEALTSPAATVLCLALLQLPRDAARMYLAVFGWRQAVQGSLARFNC